MPKTVDIRVYRSLRPSHNMALSEARALAKRLALSGFAVEAIVCHPMGDGMGWGITGEISEADVVAAGVPVDEPIHLLYKFAGAPDADRHVCELVSEVFGEGGMEGIQRLHASVLTSNDPANHPLGWVSRLLSIPRVVKAINEALTAPEEKSK